MGTSTPEQHAGRSAELQRLLDEADNKPASGQFRSRPVTAPRNAVRAPAPATRTSAEPPSPAKASTGTSPSISKRSPLRSAPPTTFPRRAAAVTSKPADPSDRNAPRQAEPNGDVSARLRRPALVRSPIGGAGARRLRSDRSADPAGQVHRVNGAAGAASPATRAAGAASPAARAAGAASPAARAAGRAVSPSMKTAAARSLAGRWGASGFSPVLPEHRAAVEVPLLPQHAGRRAPTAMPRPAPAGADRQPDRESVQARRPRGTTEPATGAAVAGRTEQVSTALPLDGRPRQRRTLVLAGGAAAAVVAIFAIVSLGNHSGSGPAAGSDPTPDKVAMVQSTGLDGEPTVTTVTAPVSTVNGRAVALVPDANGLIRPLMVITVTPPAAATRSSSPATTAPRSSGRPAGAGAGTSSAVATTPKAAPAPSPTPTPTPSSAPTTRPVPSTTANPAPAGPGDDVATVVTGLTTLTGWVPITTG